MEGGQLRQVTLDYNHNFKFNTLHPPFLQYLTSLDFLELLFLLAEGQNYILIRNFFEIPMQKYNQQVRDILLIGLSQISLNFSSNLLEELYQQLFPMYLLNHVNSIPILETIWKYNPHMMINAICQMWKKDNSIINLSRVLDICQEIKDSLIIIANSSNYSFSVSLGILANRRDFLHFDQWIAERIRTQGNHFIRALLNYIEENLMQGCRQQQSQQTLEKSQLTIETLSVIFQNLLISFFDKLCLKNQQRIGNLYNEICKYFPSLTSASTCLLYTSPSPRDRQKSRMPSSA
eukprot:TRINITY_DN9382_c0_g1_i1.p1 TRINITY_DN9382_c0_g1~~TRINITY_DN9382_c0_g1_i1.p1  ORF type:complete len:291 (-),score=29.14 TRINITY_DN9382_c0_g1_i1:50-922(-)